MIIPQLNEYVYPYPSNRNHSSNLNPRKGLIVAVEGIDGSGKSTFTKKLTKALSCDYKVYTGNFIHSKWFKDILLQFKYFNCDEYSFTLLYTTALSRFFTEVVSEKLERDFIVILDRYILTILSRGVVRGVNRRWINSLLSIFKKPDISIFIDTDVELCLKRKCLSNNILSYWECGCVLSSDDSLRLKYDALKYQDCFRQYQTKIRKILYTETNLLGGYCLNGTDMNNELKIRSLINERFC